MNPMVEEYLTAKGRQKQEKLDEEERKLAEEQQAAAPSVRGSAASGRNL